MTALLGVDGPSKSTETSSEEDRLPSAEDGSDRLNNAPGQQPDGHNDGDRDSSFSDDDATASSSASSARDPFFAFIPQIFKFAGNVVAGEANTVKNAVVGFPSWSKRYTTDTYRYYRAKPRVLFDEVLSGFTVAIMQVPESIAFSFVAGVPPLSGTFFFPLPRNQIQKPRVSAAGSMHMATIRQQHKTVVLNLFISFERRALVRSSSDLLDGHYYGHLRRKARYVVCIISVKLLIFNSNSTVSRQSSRVSPIKAYSLVTALAYI